MKLKPRSQLIFFWFSVYFFLTGFSSLPFNPFNPFNPSNPFAGVRRVRGFSAHWSTGNGVGRSFANRLVEWRYVQYIWSSTRLSHNVSSSPSPPSFPFRHHRKAIATALTLYLQSLGQQRVKATEANLIYTSQPLWATFFAYAFLHEKLDVEILPGIGLIAFAVALALSGGEDGSGGTEVLPGSLEETVADRLSEPSIEIH